MIILNEIDERIFPFEKELLGMFNKIKFVKRIGQIKDRNYSAYSPRKDQIIMSCYLPRVSHEIAHMVEMNNFNRLIIDDWGLNTDPIAFLSKPKRAFVGVARECRVKAIESYLHTPGYPNSQIMADVWYDNMYQHIGFGKFKLKDQIDDWMRSIFETTRKKWSLDRIQHEWKQRVEFIRNWQESK